MGWRETAAPIVRWGGVVIGVLFAVSGLWSMIVSFAGFNIVSFVLYVYAVYVPISISMCSSSPTRVVDVRHPLLTRVFFLCRRIFGLLLAVAEMNVWPPLAEHFGFLSNASGRAWFLFFISTLCLANGIGGRNLGMSHIFLLVMGVIGIILSIVGIVIRKDSAVVNREAVNLPGVFKGGNSTGGSARATGNDAI